VGYVPLCSAAMHAYSAEQEAFECAPNSSCKRSAGQKLTSPNGEAATNGRHLASAHDATGPLEMQSSSCGNAASSASTSMGHSPLNYTREQSIRSVYSFNQAETHFLRGTL
jgi:hypothetical protein